MDDFGLVGVETQEASNDPAVRATAILTSRGQLPCLKPPSKGYRETEMASQPNSHSIYLFSARSAPRGRILKRIHPCTKGNTGRCAACPSHASGCAPGPSWRHRANRQSSCEVSGRSAGIRQPGTQHSTPHTKAAQSSTATASTVSGVNHPNSKVQQHCSAGPKNKKPKYLEKTDWIRLMTPAD